MKASQFLFLRPLQFVDTSADSLASSSLARCFSRLPNFLCSFWLRVISTREMDSALRFNSLWLLRI